MRDCRNKILELFSRDNLPPSLKVNYDFSEKDLYGKTVAFIKSLELFSWFFKKQKKPRFPEALVLYRDSLSICKRYLF